MAPLPEYRIRHSPKSKNLRLRVSREDGLCVVVPHGYDERKIPAILGRKKRWIADALSALAETRRFLEAKPLTRLPNYVRLVALGESWQVIYREDNARPGARLRAENGELIISGVALDGDDVMKKLKEWLRLRVREDLIPVVENLAEKHSLKLNHVLVKSQRTRWASCSARRNISLNTKLLFLSPELVRYVLIHELCHTIHMNHTNEFWTLVAAYEPRYKTLDKALRQGWKTVPQWMF